MPQTSAPFDFSANASACRRQTLRISGAFALAIRSKSVAQYKCPMPNTQYPIPNAQKLQDLMQQVGISSFKALSRVAGVSEHQILRLRQGKLEQMRVDVLLKLSSGLQIPLSELVATFSTVDLSGIVTRNYRFKRRVRSLAATNRTAARDITTRTPAVEFAIAGAFIIAMANGGTESARKSTASSSQNSTVGAETPGKAFTGVGSGSDRTRGSRITIQSPTAPIDRGDCTTWRNSQGTVHWLSSR